MHVEYIFFQSNGSKHSPLVLICLPSLHECPGGGYFCSFLEAPGAPCVLEWGFAPLAKTSCGWRGTSQCHSPELRRLWLSVMASYFSPHLLQTQPGHLVCVCCPSPLPASFLSLPCAALSLTQSSDISERAPDSCTQRLAKMPTDNVGWRLLFFFFIFFLLRRSP